VLSAADDRRMAVLRQFSSRAEAYGSLLLLKGLYLDVDRIIFQEGSAQKAVTSYGPAKSLSWQQGPERFDEYSNEVILERFMKGAENGDHEGTFLLEVKDRLGRNYRLPIADASWSVEGGTTKFVKLEYVY
jgi:hypothetical protein